MTPRLAPLDSLPVSEKIVLFRPLGSTDLDTHGNEPGLAL